MFSMMAVVRVKNFDEEIQDVVLWSKGRQRNARKRKPNDAKQLGKIPNGALCSLLETNDQGFCRIEHGLTDAAWEIKGTMGWVQEKHTQLLGPCWTDELLREKRDFVGRHHNTSGPSTLEQGVWLHTEDEQVPEGVWLHTEDEQVPQAPLPGRAQASASTTRTGSSGPSGPTQASVAIAPDHTESPSRNPPQACSPRRRSRSPPRDARKPYNVFAMSPLPTE